MDTEQLAQTGTMPKWAPEPRSARRPPDARGAYGLDGDDTITVNKKIKLRAELYGGAGNDRLTSGGGDVVVGGQGDDRLTGNSGRDLLIGSPGIDRLTGNAGEDILIGGATIYDNHAATLRDLLGVWAPPQRRSARIAALEDPARLRHLRAGDTVLDDQAVDSVFGQSGTGWIIG